MQLRTKARLRTKMQLRTKNQLRNRCNQGLDATQVAKTIETIGNVKDPQEAPS